MCVCGKTYRQKAWFSPLEEKKGEREREISKLKKKKDFQRHINRLQYMHLISISVAVYCNFFFKLWDKEI